MNRGTVKVSHMTNDENVATLEIPYQMREIQISVNPISPLVICVIFPFSYESMKVVPWKYDATAYVQGGNIENKWLVISYPTITNIVGSGRMVRSGRVFVPHKKKIKVTRP